MMRDYGGGVLSWRPLLGRAGDVRELALIDSSGSVVKHQGDLFGRSSRVARLCLMLASIALYMYGSM